MLHGCTASIPSEAKATVFNFLLKNFNDNLQILLYSVLSFPFHDLYLTCRMFYTVSERWASFKNQSYQLIHTSVVCQSNGYSQNFFPNFCTLKFMSGSELTYMS